MTIAVRIQRLVRQSAGMTAAVSIAAATTAFIYAAPGDQTIVKDSVAAAGWTLIVPTNVDGNALTDYLSYNATTGRAIVSVGVGHSGEQRIVKDSMAAVGWTLIVPLNVDGDDLTDYLSYNATTGRAIVSVGVGHAGEQKIVKDSMAAVGWTAIVPINVDGTGGDDLLSYNAATGRAIVSVAVGDKGNQRIVKDYVAAQGWTAIVPINVDNDVAARTDFISYNARTGRAIVSIGIGDVGDQQIVKDYMAAPGWTAIVPINVDCDPGGVTDFLSYNATTGRAIVSVGFGSSGEQKIVKDYAAATGWTSVVPMNVDGQDAVTDLLSYNRRTGRAIVSTGEFCAPGPG